jgi:hypothetical protein
LDCILNGANDSSTSCIHMSAILLLLLIETRGRGRVGLQQQSICNTFPESQIEVSFGSSGFEHCIDENLKGR